MRCHTFQYTEVGSNHYLHQPWARMLPFPRIAGRGEILAMGSFSTHWAVSDRCPAPESCAVRPNFMDAGFAGAVLSAHQSRERIVGCGRAGGRTERPRAVARVSAGHRALDRRCAEDWESLHALPCQMRQAVLFPNPFCTPQLSTESKPNCHVALSRIPRSMIGVDENLCVHSPIVPTDAAAYPNLETSMTATAPI